MDNALLCAIQKKYNKNIDNMHKKKSDTIEDVDNNGYEKVARFTAEGNLSSVSLVMENIKKIIDVTMNHHGLFFSVNGHDNSLKIPCITYDVVSRELSSKTPLSSVKINSIKEYVDGKATGDHFEIYTSFFDCIVEFNIYGRNKTNSIEIQEEFEEALELYKGYLKNQGLSNMYFVKEVSSIESLKNKSYHGVTLVYFLEIQKIKSIRASSLNSVGITIEDKINKDNQDVINAIDILDELSKNNKLI